MKTVSVRSLRTALVAAALCASALIGTSSAFAGYTEIGSFAGGGPGPGGEGTADGQLFNPGQAGVNSATGKLYVADTNNNRVQVFKPTATAGEYDSQVAVTAPTGLAIDQSNGAVYVANATGISKFTEALAPAAGWTAPGVSGRLAVDPTSGDLLVADTAANLIRRFESDGTPAGSFAAERPIDLATRSNGDVLVITSTGDVLKTCGEPTSTVRRYTAAGTEVGVVAPSLQYPGAIAVDPEDNGVLIASEINGYYCSGGFGYFKLSALSAGGAEQQTIVIEDNNYATVPGLAAQGGGSPRAYMVTKSPELDQWGATKIIALEEQPEPEATIDPVDPETVGATSATFSGSVDPNGEPTSYWFEYSADGGQSWSSTLSESAGEGEVPVSVQAEVEDLLPSTVYTVRLAIESANNSSASDSVQFETDTSAPMLNLLPPTAIGPDSARIRGEVNPSGQATTYYFEYGMTAAYGSRSPLTAGQAGAGKVAIGVSRLLQGLQPQTTYHYRLVAENSIGRSETEDATFTTTAVSVSCPNEAIRVDQGSTGLPDCRAYEMVTPPESRASIDISAADFALADGNGVFFISPDSLPGAVPNGPEPAYDSWFGRRTANGWTTEWTTDAPEGVPGVQGSRTLLSNSDGTRTVMNTESSVDPADDFFHSVDPYLREAGGNKIWLTPAPRDDIEFRDALAATPDLGRIVVESEEAALTPDDTDNKNDVYVWEDGELTLQTPGTETSSGVPLLGENAMGAPGVISADGGRVFFEARDSLVSEDNDAAVDIYLREDDSVTRLISVDWQTTPTVSDNDAAFLAASEDGSVVCFGTSAPLLDGDTDGQEDVYCYDLDADTLERSSAGMGDNLPILSRPLRLSSDGSTVFFMTLSPLTPDDLDGAPSLFARSGGTTRYISPLAILDLFTNRRAASTEQKYRALTVSADGGVAVFTTAAPALPADTDAASDVYRWSVDGGLELLSVGPAGGNGAMGSATMSQGERPDLMTGYALGGRVISDDGDTVFFESEEGLVQGDNDGGETDVYEWREGRGLRLISPAGAYPGDAQYVDNSADGRTVFFVTPERVLSRDVNGSIRDLYAARVDGGFAEPPPPLACVGDGCQGPASAPPAIPPAATAVNAGQGNLSERRAKKRRTCPKGKRKVRAKGKVRCVPKRKKQRGAKSRTAGTNKGGQR